MCNDQHNEKDKKKSHLLPESKIIEEKKTLVQIEFNVSHPQDSRNILAVVSYSLAKRKELQNIY